MARDKVGGAGSEGDKAKGGGVPSKGKKFEKRFEYQNPETFASAEVSQMYLSALHVCKVYGHYSSDLIEFIRLCWDEWVINFYQPPPPPPRRHASL